MRQLLVACTARNIPARIAAQSFVHRTIATTLFPGWVHAAQISRPLILTLSWVVRGASSSSAPLTAVAFHKHADQELEELFDVYDTFGENKGTNRAVSHTQS